jgi:hypothetical protein
MARLSIASISYNCSIRRRSRLWGSPCGRSRKPDWRRRPPRPVRSGPRWSRRGSGGRRWRRGRARGRRRERRRGVKFARRSSESPDLEPALGVGTRLAGEIGIRPFEDLVEKYRLVPDAHARDGGAYPPLRAPDFSRDQAPEQHTRTCATRPLTGSSPLPPISATSSAGPTRMHKSTSNSGVWRLAATASDAHRRAADPNVVTVGGRWEGTTEVRSSGSRIQWAAGRTL